MHLDLYCFNGNNTDRNKAKHIVCKLSSTTTDITKLLLVIFLLLSICSFGQTNNYTEKNIYKLFKHSISQRDKKKINIPSNPWLFCNKDSSFYLDDTLRLVSNSYYNLKLINCCDYVGWTFYKKDKFISTRLQLCREPANASAAKDNDHFTLKVFSINNYYAVAVFNNDKLSDSFKIIDISNFKQDDTDLTSTIITLLRLNYNGNLFRN